MTRRSAPRRILRDPDACVDCGACVGQCKTRALAVDRATYSVVLDSARCNACGLCIEACPFAAIFAVDARVAATIEREGRHVADSQL